MSIFKRPDLKKPKVAIYLRRSKGEGGATIDQLASVMQTIERWEKDGIIQKVNRGVKGRSIDKKYRGVNLDLEGDIFNEGEAESGFKVEERKVFVDLVKRLRKGEYDGVIAIDMERFARDFGALSAFAYDTWREQDIPSFYHGIIDKLTLGTTTTDSFTDEAIVNSKMTWGGVATRGNIKKGERKRKTTTVDRGYFLGSKPEWLGKQYRGNTQTRPVYYRRAWESLRTGGSSTDVAREAGKFQKNGQPDRKFAQNWGKRLQGYHDMGVLEDWLENVEDLTEYIRQKSPTQPKTGYKLTDNIRTNTAGYFAYPNGVLIVDEETGKRELVRFPKPNDFDFDELNANKDPSNVEGYDVTREEIDKDFPLHFYQIQNRKNSEKKKGKK